MTRESPMGPPTRPPNDIEAELRSMMHRRAEAVRPQRPDWSILEFDLGELKLEPYRPGASQDNAERKRQMLSRARPYAAAASVLAIVLAGAVVFDLYSSGGGNDAADREEAASPASAPSAPPTDTVPAPGSTGFDPAEAAPFYPFTDVERAVDWFDERPTVDPVEMTRTYLSQAGVVEGSGIIRTVVVDIARDDGEPKPTSAEWAAMRDACMAWSTWGKPGSKVITSGHVCLRRAADVIDPEQGSDGSWLIVGARTEGIALQEVRRDGERISFTVDRDEDTARFPDVRVEVNDELVREGEVGLEGPETFLVDVAADDVAVIQLQHREGRNPVSIAAMAVPAQP